MNTAIKINPPQIIHGMPCDEYRALPALAQSDLSWFKYSPQHFKRRAELQKETDAMRLGTIFHAAILESARFKDAYVLEPDMITIDGKHVEVNKRVAKHREYLAGWRLENAHRMILSEKDYESTLRMVKSVTEDKELCALIGSGETEVVSLFDLNGRPCKARADLVNDKNPHGRLVIDFKKTQDASESGFTRSIFNFGYDLQSAFYKEAFGADKFLFVAVEEKTGAIGKWDAFHYLERGRKLVDKFMGELAECERTGVWPWYSKNGFELIRPPTWVAAMDEEKE